MAFSGKAQGAGARTDRDSRRYRANALRPVTVSHVRDSLRGDVL